MQLTHYMRKEVSGLAFTTLELVGAEEQLGHTACIKEPSGDVLYGREPAQSDVEVIHSQLPMTSYHNSTPRFMWMHGEPLSSVGNGVSMRAIVDLAPKTDAFICMRKEEWAYWNAIKRTYVVPKGIDLDVFKPLPVTSQPKLSGSPSVLYMEHWRGQRNPLPLCQAMQIVHDQLPNARLHLYNCGDKKMFETFQALIRHNKWWTFIRSLQGPVKPAEVNDLLNRCDIVVSCLYPLYARSIEAFGAGKAFLGPGYSDPEYPWHCTLDPESMAQAILDIHANYDRVNYREWAERKHNVKETARQSVEIYGRYC